MSEEEIISYIIASVSILRNDNILFTEKSRNKLADRIKSLLDLYNKEKEKNKELMKPKYIIDCKTMKVEKLTNDYISKDKLFELLNKYEKESFIAKVDLRKLLEV